METVDKEDTINKSILLNWLYSADKELTLSELGKWIEARTGGWRLGASYVPGDYFNGYIDDVRITLGYARYTATFTAPTAAFPLQ